MKGEIMTYTEAELAELFERSKDDRAIIVGSEVRVLVSMAQKYLERCSEAVERDKVLAEVVDRISMEYLTDKTGTEGDEAYDSAVANCIGAVISMMASQPVSKGSKL